MALALEGSLKQEPSVQFLRVWTIGIMDHWFTIILWSLVRIQPGHSIAEGVSRSRVSNALSGDLRSVFGSNAILL